MYIKKHELLGDIVRTSLLLMLLMSYKPASASTFSFDVTNANDDVLFDQIKC